LRPLLSLPRWQAEAFYFRLDGAAGATYLLQASSNLRDWTTFATNDAAEWQPIIGMPAIHQNGFVRASLADPVYPLFNFAIRSGIGLVSNTVGIVVGSYDSSDPLFSTMGRYDPSKAKDGGDLALGFGYDGIHYLGNSSIKGKVFTTGATVMLGPNGQIGDNVWTGSGIQPGWTSTNLRSTFMPPPVAVPFAGGIVPPRGTIGGVHYDYVLENGDYRLNTINSQEIFVAGNARLYVSGPTQIREILISTNASLQLFCAGDAALGSVINYNYGDVTSFQFYGLPSNSLLTVSPNAAFIGLIYAPNAYCHMAVGGGGTLDFLGACIVRELRATNVRMHFDEHLKRFCRP
jgi:hypothetical protein